MLQKNPYFLPLNSFFPAVQALKNGEIIAFETDTIPGLAVDAFNDFALKKLYLLKNRCDSKKFVWMFPNCDQFSKYFLVEQKILKLSQMLWPGPFTLIFDTPRLQTPTQAVRIPKVPQLLDFLEKCSFPLAVTSANKSGDTPAHSLKEVWDIFGENISFYLDFKVQNSGSPSLVLDVSKGKWKILRKGDEKTMQKWFDCTKKIGF